jgi:hypothetical protein
VQHSKISCRLAAMGHFETKSEAASLPVYWSGPPPRADVLHLAFVLNNGLGSPIARGGSRPAACSLRSSLAEWRCSWHGSAEKTAGHCGRFHQHG